MTALPVTSGDEILIKLFFANPLSLEGAAHENRVGKGVRELFLEPALRRSLREVTTVIYDSLPYGQF